MKVRKKPCRHCLFTKHAVVDRNTLIQQRDIILSSDRPFQCHEHSDKVMCASQAVKRSDLSKGMEIIHCNGDLKHKYSNMTKEERNKYTVGGI